VPELSDLLLTPEQAAAMDAPGTKDAAVLVPLYHDLVAVFTERRADLPQHAGEISFPGGRQDHPDEDLRLSSWLGRCRPSAPSSPATASIRSSG
jgi:8-oxo-dGTP pyrophosphatase MutT (NUDIX family)